MPTRRISVERARRLALGAQGLARRRRRIRTDIRHFRQVLARLRLVQLDSVNVLARAHYLPFFSRLGPYDRGALDRWLWGSGEVVEYWAHEASLLPVEDWPLLRHRMEGGWHWDSVERIGREHPDYVEWVLAEVRRRGPLTPRQVDDAPAPAGTWWEWGKAKLALEYLFLTGRVTTAGRVNFARRYDLTERVLPSSVRAEPAIPAEEAQSRLLLAAARAHGIGTVHDLADYYRIRAPVARPLLSRLASSGALEEVEVDGWKGPVYLHPEASTPRRADGRALLAPFDPVVWFRPRVERLFNFQYRIEIYVPAARRVYGYYVLPFLLGDRLVARVDLKADRQAGLLRVRGAFAEQGVDRLHVGRELAEELEEMAAWLELGGVEVEERGDLAAPLIKCVT